MKNKDAFVTGRELGNKLADALGLQLVRNLSISTPVNGVATVKAEMLITNEQADKVETILKSYDVVERKGEK